MATIKSFEDLEIWKDGVEIAVAIYKFSSQGKIEKDFGLRDQLRRSAVSISANIAEGFEYNNKPDFVRYLRYSKGSAGELRSHITILKKAALMPPEQADDFCEKLKTQGNKTGKLISYLEKIMNRKKPANPTTR